MITPEDQLVQTCNSALRELFFHCDTESEYDSYRIKFINILTQRTILSSEDLSPFFPIWNDLVEKLTV